MGETRRKVGWRYKLRLGDVFHDEARSFTERRDEIVRRIEAAPFWDAHDPVLVAITEELSDADDVEWFDNAWDAFYDWCDDSRVWVVTRAVGLLMWEPLQDTKEQK